ADVAPDGDGIGVDVHQIAATVPVDVDDVHPRRVVETVEDGRRGHRDLVAPAAVGTGRPVGHAASVDADDVSETIACHVGEVHMRVGQHDRRRHVCGEDPGDGSPRVGIPPQVPEPGVACVDEDVGDPVTVQVEQAHPRVGHQYRGGVREGHREAE